MQITNLNFLVAEDDDFQRRWLVIMLGNLGARNIIEAADGLAALAALQDKSQKIDICFIDLNMPGMDGMEVIRHMAKENLQTSIILASALDSSLLFSVGTMSKAYGIDLLGIIEKPATPESLMSLIKLFRPPQTRLKSVEKVPQFTLAEIQHGLQNQEFEPFFQPKVELASGQVKGAEAFARWTHPQYGVISPAVFIPVLEENGAMDALAWVVIKKSVAACRMWHEQGFPITVSINISPSSLGKEGLAEQIAEYVAQQRLDPQFVVLEITESAAVTNVPNFLENLARLRMKGFGLSVDDYGTGNSSMQQLLRIPFSELKIDRTFVAGAFENHALELVLSASLELCRKLNRHSVAVGVETQQDWDFMKKLGCTYVQGYYVAKPMEAAALPVWMDEWAHFF
jgi:EAL domain-containing protein (putative c-di-GMP-specific phosphodiesterase class I)/DNA-binding NarL/FixJ family response regulator